MNLEAFVYCQIVLVLIVAGYRTYLDMRSTKRLNRLEEIQEELRQMDKEVDP